MEKLDYTGNGRIQVSVTDLLKSPDVQRQVAVVKKIEEEMKKDMTDTTSSEMIRLSDLLAQTQAELAAAKERVRELEQALRGALDKAARCVEIRGKEYVEKWGEDGNGNGLDDMAKSYAWDCLQHAIAIRALDPEAKGADEIKQLEADLLHACSIGMATILVRCGAYVSLSPYLQGQYDELSRLYAKCDRAFNASLQSGAEKDGQVAWLPLSDAPMWIADRSALVGEYVAGYGWKKVAVWETAWTRDGIAARGGTHWWPHLRDLPPPCTVT